MIDYATHFDFHNHVRTFIPKNDASKTLVCYDNE